MVARRPLARRPIAAIAAVGLLGLSLTGCFNPFNPKVLGIGFPDPPPAPNSPGGVLDLFQWCYEHRAIAEYKELFTDDYRFVFSPLDSSGAQYRDTPWTREDEVTSTSNLFLGGDPTQPAAASILLALDPNFQVRNDVRPGKNPRWHKTIRTTVTLTINDVVGGVTNVTGFSRFFLCRGDSALIPRELIDRGFGPDSTRWYIERWEDETAQPGYLVSGVPASISSMRGSVSSAEAQPSVSLTWGTVKAHYRLPLVR